MKTNKISSLLLIAIISVSSRTIGQTLGVCVSSTVTPTCSSNLNAISGGTWTSSNTSVATVGSTTGIITGVSAGSATISYNNTSCGNILATYPVSVNVPAAAITGSTIICIGTSSTLSDATPGGTWSTSIGYVSIGSTSGIVSGYSPGTDVITYSVTNYCGPTTATINVTAYGLIGNIYTIGGDGTSGVTGDGGPLLLAKVSGARDLATDASGSKN